VITGVGGAVGGADDGATVLPHAEKKRERPTISAKIARIA
jgi:hypothetical protein